MSAPNLNTDRVWSESQGGSRAAPTLATEGVNLSDVTGYVVTIYPVTTPGTTTFTSGNIRAWRWSSVTERWARWPDGDKAVTASVKEMWWEVSAPVALGRVLYATDTVVLSAGTDTVVRVEPVLRGQG